jgi:tetratricopeptide (TPR) repeat protein
LPSPHKLADEQFRRGIELNGDAVALSWYGDFLTDMRRFDDARDAYKRSQSVNPRWLEPPIFAANIHAFTGQPALAIVEQQRLLETEPNYGLGNFSLGLSHLASGDLPKAIELLRKSNEIIPRADGADESALLIYLYVKVFTPRPGEPVFETFAVVSTIGCIVIFVALIQANRAHKDEPNSGH